MSKSKKPSGLSVTRNGNTYKLAWKIGDSDYGNAMVMARISGIESMMGGGLSLQ